MKLILFILIILPLSSHSAQTNPELAKRLNGKWASKVKERYTLYSIERAISINYPDITLIFNAYENSNSKELLLTQTMEGKISLLVNNKINSRAYNIDTVLSKNVLEIKKKSSVLEGLKLESCMTPGKPLDIMTNGCGLYTNQKKLVKLRHMVLLTDNNQLFLGSLAKIAAKKRTKIISVYPLEKTTK